MDALRVASRPLSARAVRLGAFAVALLVLAGLALFSTASMLWPRVEDRSDVDVPYDPEGPVAQPFRAFDLEGWLVRQSDGRVRAFSAVSPHLRCRVIVVMPGDRRYQFGQWEEQHRAGFFFDVCYNSTWTLDGLRTFGPAPRGLDEFNVNDVDRDSVSLDLSRVRVGSCAFENDPYCSTPDHPRYRPP